MGREHCLGGYALNPSLEAVAVRDGSGLEDCMVMVSLRPLTALMTRDWFCHGNTKHKSNGGSRRVLLQNAHGGIGICSSRRSPFCDLGNAQANDRALLELRNMSGTRNTQKASVAQTRNKSVADALLL